MSPGLFIAAHYNAENQSARVVYPKMKCRELTKYPLGIASANRETYWEIFSTAQEQNLIVLDHFYYKSKIIIILTRFKIG